METTCGYCGVTIYRRPCRIESTKYGSNYCCPSHQMKHQLQLGVFNTETMTKKAIEIRTGKRWPRPKQNTPPTKYEQYFINFIKAHNLPFDYCGDGSVIIGQINPDFIHRTKKKVIEVWTGTKHEERRKEYEKEGFDVLWVNVKSMNINSEIVEAIIQFSR